MNSALSYVNLRRSVPGMSNARNTFIGRSRSERLKDY